MKVPFLDLGRQYEQLKDEIELKVIECMRSCAYIEGEAVKKFEKHIEKFLRVKHVITCASGTSALEIALKACGVNPGDEVITTPFSFFATAEAISAVGATPVFVDIREEDYNIDADLIEEKITDKTVAILPVHIFGYPADMDKINKIASGHGLRVIEDACQAIGTTYKGRRAGTLGDAGCFSFYPTKNLGAFGDGGMITTNDEGIAKVCRALKAHAGGKTGYEAAKILGMEAGVQMPEEESQDPLYDPYKYYNFLVADNSRLDSIQAAVLDVKLSYLNEFNKKRAQIAKRYSAELKHTCLTNPSYQDTGTSCWHQYVVRTEKKEELIKFLADNDIGAGAFYPVPLHLQSAFSDLGYKQGDLPVAEKICKETVCLPIFPELTLGEQEYVIDTVKKFLG